MKLLTLGSDEQGDFALCGGYFRPLNVNQIM
jgi:hypothetical protein